jgi:hypothetical protein
MSQYKSDNQLAQAILDRLIRNNKVYPKILATLGNIVTRNK